MRKDRRLGWAKLVGGAMCAALLTGEFALVWGEEVALFSAVLWTVVIVWFAGNLYRGVIILTAHEIVVKGLVLLRRWPRTHVASVVCATVLLGPYRRSYDLLFVLDAHGNVLIRVDKEQFRTEDLDRLVDALGMPCDGPDYAVSAKELQRTHPGLMPWFARHPVLVGLAFTVVIAPAVAVVAITVPSAR